MMKKTFYFLALLPLYMFGQTQVADKVSPAEASVKEGIHFEHGIFTELLSKAQKENKMIMVDAYASWCGPCKWMAKNIFPNDTVAEFYNKNFISAKIDMEKGEGVDLAKKYQVTCYPTFLFIDKNGQLLHRLSGSMNTKDFVALGANAMDPAKQFASVKKNFDSGTASPAELLRYITMRSNSCMPVTDELVKYFSTQKDEELTSRQNWSVLRDFSNDPNSHEFGYFVSHRADFEKLYTADSVSKKTEDIYSAALMGFTRKKEPDREGYNKMKAQVLQANVPSSEKIILNADMSLYARTKDWNNYSVTAVKYADKYAMDNYNQLNSIAWNFYENVTDKALLAKAEGWAAHSVELHPGYFNCDTYSAVLYKIGKKAEAQSAAEKAIEFAKKEGADFGSTQELLDKIKAMK